MAIYSVHNRDGSPDDQALFVREGFSMGAFVFTVLWALCHRMWLVAGILLAISGAVALAGRYFGIGDSITVLASFVVSLIFGFEAREFQMGSLIARGYGQIGISHGRNLEEAELRYYLSSAVPSAPPSPVTPKLPPRIHAPDTLGIFGNV